MGTKILRNCFDFEELFLRRELYEYSVKGLFARHVCMTVEERLYDTTKIIIYA